MTKVLLVVTHAEYGGVTTQLRLLAQGLPRDRFEPRVCVLGAGGPAAKALAAAGVPVDVLGWTRLFDGRPLWRLRRLVADFRPAVLHVWQPAALRVVAATVGGAGCRLVVSAPLAADRQSVWWALDRWLLRRADRLIVTGPAEGEHCRRLGIPPERVTAIPPGVEVPADDDARRPVGRELAALMPPSARRVACVGPFEPNKVFRDALWAFDMLRYLYNELHLLLIGTGSDEGRLDTFIRTIHAERTIHRLGPRGDVPALLGLVEAVWVPSRGPAGLFTALEAMAAGTPVIASKVPGLSDIVLDGETGFLVPPGDKVAIARQTRLLFEDAARRRRLGQRGRERVQGQFTAADMVRRFAQVYEGVRPRAHQKQPALPESRVGTAHR
jgi:glycosyltransferase involved in cell wall biosynthesis